MRNRTSSSIREQQLDAALNRAWDAVHACRASGDLSEEACREAAGRVQAWAAVAYAEAELLYPPPDFW